MAPPTDLRDAGERIEALMGCLERSLGANELADVHDVLALVTALYGGGLARIVELVGDDALGERLADDELVASLLIVHDLHPVGAEQRVRRAIESVRPYLGTHGGDVEVLSLDVDEGVVSLRMLGSCDGCASASDTLEHAVQAAIEQAAPEIARIDVAGSASSLDGPGPTPVTLGRKRS